MKVTAGVEKRVLMNLLRKRGLHENEISQVQSVARIASIYQDPVRSILYSAKTDRYTLVE